MTILFSSNKIDAQSQNCGFESGNTADWKLSNGKFTDNGVVPIYSSEVIGTVGSGHIITNKSDGNYPKISSEEIPIVAPGSDYSVRFGNVNLGGAFLGYKIIYHHARKYTFPIQICRCFAGRFKRTCFLSKTWIWG